MVNETMSTAEKPIRPTYYVRHPDGTFSIAEPQPSPDDIEAQRGTTYALCDRAHSGSCCEDPDCYRAQPAADGAQRVSDGICLPNGLMFDAFGEPRTRYVRVTLDGSHCIMHPSEGDTYLSDAKANGDESAYEVADVYLSEREFDALGEFPEAS